MEYFTAQRIELYKSKLQKQLQCKKLVIGTPSLQKQRSCPPFFLGRCPTVMVHDGFITDKHTHKQHWRGPTGNSVCFQCWCSIFLSLSLLTLLEIRVHMLALLAITTHTSTWMQLAPELKKYINFKQKVPLSRNFYPINNWKWWMVFTTMCSTLQTRFGHTSNRKRDQESNGTDCK